MALTIKKNQKLAAEIEVTEGTYVAPSSGASFITVLEDGFELNGTKEAIERNILGTGLSKPTPRTANRAAAGTIPTEYKASGVEGQAPEVDPLHQASFGSKRSGATITADDTDSSEAYSTTRFPILDADIGTIAVGDIIMIKRAGAYHVSPVSGIGSSTGAAYVETLLPNATPYQDGDVVAAFTTYIAANSGHPTVSLTKYTEDAVEEQYRGCRVSTLALESFAANTTANFSHTIEGLDFADALAAPAFTASFDAGLPPIIVSACIYQNTNKIDMSEMSWTIENTISTATSTCEASGKLSSRISDRTVTGTLNPYKEDDNLTFQDQFDQDTEFSIFGFAANPTGTSGEIKDVVAFYMPSCTITELTEGDLDGTLQHAITFQASGGASGNENAEIYLGYI